jgi:hypothetical protein
MISRVTCARQDQVSTVGYQIRRMNLHLTAISRLLVAECAIVNALVTRQAIVVAFMNTALYAKQVTGAALRPAYLDAGLEVYYCAVKRSAQLFDA